MALIKYIIAGELLAVLILLNLYFLQAPILAVFLTFVYIVAMSLGWGLALKIKIGFWQFFHGLPIFLSLLTVAGGITYFFYQINQLVIGAFLIVAPVILLIATPLMRGRSDDEIKDAPITTSLFDWKSLIVLLIFLGLMAQNFRLLFLAATSSSLRSPFEVLNPDFFVYYFLAALSLLFLLRRSVSKLTILAAAAFFFLSFSIALVIYQVGFGFDPFVHQATEKLIFEKGLVTPKPFYYLGQYFLVVFLTKISLISVDLIDRFLVPVLAAILIPTLFIFALKRWQMKSKSGLSTLTPLFLILPYSAFTLTTPQSLANLFLLLTFINSINKINGIYRGWGLVLTALASLLIHPLAGIPAFLFLLIWTTSNWRRSAGQAFLKNIVWTGLIFLSGLSIPMIFLVQSAISRHFSAGFNFLLEGENFFPAFFWLKPQLERNFDWSFDIAYFWGQNIYLIYLALAAVGGLVSIKLKIWEKLEGYFWTFLILLINYIFLQAWFDFPFLIEYERTNYAQRIFQLSFYFLFPFVLIFYYRAFERSAIRIIFGLIFFSFLILNSLYFSYPRHNLYETGHNISTSESDIKAVASIEKVATSDYLVLANQSVSAAALKELGFKKYYKTDQGEVFFYPIPTGGHLYKFYLSMAYQRPSRETVKAAADLVGVKEAYFVINRYWVGYDRIVETAKSEADDWWPIDKAAHVFQYKFNN